VVNNVPTPYRCFLFNQLWEVGQDAGIALEVAYQAQRVSVHARWDPAAMVQRYPFWYARALTRRGERIAQAFSPRILSPDLIRAARSGRYRYLMYSPFMSLAGALLAVTPSPGLRRIFWSESNVESTRHRTGPLAWLKAALARTSDALAVPGDRALDYLHAIAPALAGRPVLRLPNLIDGERVSRSVDSLRASVPGPREALGLPSDRLLILSIGRMESRKGFEAAIQAVLAAPDDFVYCVLGGGERLEEYRRMVSAAGARRRILLPGVVDESRIPHYLAAADWFWHPALADPSPLVCIEALFAGLPLAVSRQTGNAPETVRSGMNGLVFDAASAESLAQCLRTMREMPPGRRRAMAGESRRLAWDAFDPARVCRDFIRGLAAL
jgi:glycosyltransferase involved in cell wall biosynthesis